MSSVVFLLTSCALARSFHPVGIRSFSQRLSLFLRTSIFSGHKDICEMTNWMKIFNQEECLPKAELAYRSAISYNIQQCRITVYHWVRRHFQWRRPCTCAVLQGSWSGLQKNAPWPYRKLFLFLQCFFIGEFLTLMWVKYWETIPQITINMLYSP